MTDPRLIKYHIIVQLILYINSWNATQSAYKSKYASGEGSRARSHSSIPNAASSNDAAPRPNANIGENWLALHIYVRSTPSVYHADIHHSESVGTRTKRDKQCEIRTRLARGPTQWSHHRWWDAQLDFWQLSRNNASQTIDTQTGRRQTISKYGPIRSTEFIAG